MRKILTTANYEQSRTFLFYQRAYLSHCHENNMVYRLCDDCKKKVEKKALECHECGSENLVFKYNCRLEFSDHTGSIICVLFDTVAQKLIGKPVLTKVVQQMKSMR